MVALGIRKLQPASLLCLRMRECLVVAMGAGAKIVCALAVKRRGTITLVQYAAYLTLPLLPVSREMGGGSGEYNSILITLVRAALHLLFLPR